MTKQDFNKLDLRKQLTDDLKGQWFYQQRKWGLRINKHSVVFDKDFKFVCEYHPQEIIEETEDRVVEKDIIINGVVEFKKGETFHYEKGEILSEAYISVAEYINGRECETLMFCDDSRYSDDVNDILERILVYIANYI